MSLAIGLVGCNGTQSTSSTSTEKSEKSSKPNIIYIMSDDHAFQSISAYGSEISKVAPTPNIDRLAETGVIFDRSYVTNSLCGPSRATMLTGKFGHKNGFMQNGDLFDGSQQTLPKLLQKGGYQTAMIGKWHIKSLPTGFDYWDMLNDQGEYFNPDFISATDTVKIEGYVTDIITDKSLAWLEKAKDGDKPFALWMHHKAPHRNWMPDLKYAAMYDSVTFPVPDNYFDDYKGRKAAGLQKMNIYKDMYEGHDLKMSVAVGSDSLRYDRWPHIFARLTPEQRAEWDKIYRGKNDAMNAANLEGKDMALWKYQRYMQDYHAVLKSVDVSIGRVIDYLEENNLRDNTIVIYTSDQGFFVGEHGWFDKRFMYEESSRTPLLISYPGHIPAKQLNHDLVQNIDYAPTLLDYAGLEIPEDIQGMSMKPLFEQGDEKAEWRDAIYYHYYEFPGFHSVRRQYGVRTDRYKLIKFYFRINEWELYDLEKDPKEMHNLYNDPEYVEVQKMMKTKLDELMVKYEEPPVKEWVNKKIVRKKH